MGTKIIALHAQLVDTQIQTILHQNLHYRLMIVNNAQKEHMEMKKIHRIVMEKHIVSSARKVDTVVPKLCPMQNALGYACQGITAQKIVKLLKSIQLADLHYQVTSASL